MSGPPVDTASSQHKPASLVGHQTSPVYGGLDTITGAGGRKFHLRGELQEGRIHSVEED